MTEMAFQNGLSVADVCNLEDIEIEIVKLRHRIEDLGHHRSYSLAITKLEEAAHWLRDRKHKPAGLPR